MYEHREADRVPFVDSPWSSTIERWHAEGLPQGTDYVDYFELDQFQGISADNSPRYPQATLEETDDYRVYTTRWGTTEKQWKHANSTPEFLHYTVTNPDRWREAKARMVPSTDRIPWVTLRRDYRRWRESGAWIEAGFWFGFDVAHSWMAGTETILMALVEQPEWCVEMFNHFLDLDLALFQAIWDAGYTFDSIGWPDDMGYKRHQFFSLGMYRELLKPVHQRAVQWAHQKGIKARLHSCGDINPLVPDLMEIGIDALNPLEVKAGMDPLALKRKHGKDLVLHGGINAVLWNDADAIEAEIRRTVPALKESGGYIFSSDHSIPSSVSFETFRRIVETVKDVGRY